MVTVPILTWWRHIPAPRSRAARTSAPAREAPANRDNRGGQPSDARPQLSRSVYHPEAPHVHGGDRSLGGTRSGRNYAH